MPRKGKEPIASSPEETAGTGVSYLPGRGSIFFAEEGKGAKGKDEKPFFRMNFSGTGVFSRKGDNKLLLLPLVARRVAPKRTDSFSLFALEIKTTWRPLNRKKKQFACWQERGRTPLVSVTPLFLLARGGNSLRRGGEGFLTLKKGTL